MGKFGPRCFILRLISIITIITIIAFVIDQKHRQATCVSNASVGFIHVCCFKIMATTLNQHSVQHHSSSQANDQLMNQSHP